MPFRLQKNLVCHSMCVGEAATIRMVGVKQDLGRIVTFCVCGNALEVYFSLFFSSF